MNGSTVLIEIHGYRGFGIVGGAFGRELHLGFITVFYVPLLLSEWLRERIYKLKSVSGDSHGFVEMACVGEEPRKPSMPKFVQKFPRIHK